MIAVVSQMLPQTKAARMNLNLPGSSSTLTRLAYTAPPMMMQRLPTMMKTVVVQFSLKLLA